jgi:hypothetical protein
MKQSVRPAGFLADQATVASPGSEFFSWRKIAQIARASFAASATTTTFVYPSLRVLSLRPALRSPLLVLWALAGQRDPALAWARSLIGGSPRSSIRAS